MINKCNLFTLEDFLLANKPKKLTEIDYVHAVYKLADLPIDLFFCFTKLLIPEIRIIEGSIFLDEYFDLDTYKLYLSEGKSSSEIQLWMNLIEITGVFEGVKENEAVRIAHTIIEAWNLKLQKAVDNEKGMGKARVIHDQENGEVFVTIDCA